MPREAYLRAFGRNVAALRKRSGLTQDELAERANLGTKYLSRVERGIVNPSLGTLRSLARALGTSLGVLAMEPVAVSAELAGLLAGRRKAEQARALAIVRALFRVPDESQR